MYHMVYKLDKEFNPLHFIGFHQNFCLILISQFFIISIKSQQKRTMGAASAGPLNTSGFDHSIKQGHLPQHTHITHSGIFNQKFFQIGPKTKDLLDLHIGLGVSNCDLYDMDERNYFLSMFLKSCEDGQKRKRGINICLTLDISGSMNSPLKNQYNPYLDHQVKKVEAPKTRLQLAKDATWMMFNKLEEEDIFSFVVFHNDARTVIKSQKVKNLQKQTVKKLIYQNFESGGTTIRNGFNLSLDNIRKHIHDNPGFENRIVMLTDVCDNSVQNQNMLIEDISSSESIHTTIIGVSSDFRSETCQKLKQIKGFNYLSAVENSDLQKYLVERFDYTFFPCVEDIEISLKSDEIQSISVFGSPDQETIYTQQDDGRFIVTKTKTVFPSELTTNQNKMIETLGGLILVKFFPKNKQQLPDGEIKVLLTYKDINGNNFKKQYVIRQKVEAEQYFSNSATKDGTMLFYYTETLTNLLKSMDKDKSDSNKSMYAEKLSKLKEYCPENKLQQLEDIIKIVSK